MRIFPGLRQNPRKSELAGALEVDHDRHDLSPNPAGASGKSFVRKGQNQERQNFPSNSVRHYKLEEFDLRKSDFKPWGLRSDCSSISSDADGLEFNSDSDESLYFDEDAEATKLKEEILRLHQQGVAPPHLDPAYLAWAERMEYGESTGSSESSGSIQRNPEPNLDESLGLEMDITSTSDVAREEDLVLEEVKRQQHLPKIEWRKIRPRMPKDPSLYPGFPDVESLRRCRVDEAMINDLICNFWRHFRNQKGYRNSKRKKQASKAQNSRSNSNPISPVLSPMETARTPEKSNNGELPTTTHSPLTVDLTPPSQGVVSRSAKNPNTKTKHRFPFQARVWGKRIGEPISEVDFLSLVTEIQERWLACSEAGLSLRVEGVTFVRDHGVINCSDKDTYNLVKNHIEHTTIDGRSFVVWPVGAGLRRVDCSIFVNKWLARVDVTKLIQRSLSEAGLDDQFRITRSFDKPHGRVLFLQILPEAETYIRRNDMKMWAGMATLHFRFRSKAIKACTKPQQNISNQRVVNPQSSRDNREPPTDTISTQNNNFNFSPPFSFFERRTQFSNKAKTAHNPTVTTKATQRSVYITSASRKLDKPIVQVPSKEVRLN